MYSRLAVSISFVLFCFALFFLPRGLEERLKWSARLFTAPSVAFADFTTRITREAIGGLPPQMTTDQRDALITEAANSRNALLKERADNAALDRANRELLRLLRHINQNRTHTLLMAGILRMSPFAPQAEQIIIDRGSYDGVQPGQAVQTLDGVIGLVREVSMRQSVVKLLSAPDFTMPVQIRSRNIYGLLENRNGSLCMTATTGANFASAQSGDAVFTTDIGSEATFPGLPVGKIAAIQRGEDGAPVYQITGTANLAAATYVLVSIPSGRQP